VNSSAGQMALQLPQGEWGSPFTVSRQIPAPIVGNGSAPVVKSLKRADSFAFAERPDVFDSHGDEPGFNEPAPWYAE